MKRLPNRNPVTRSPQFLVLLAMFAVAATGCSSVQFEHRPPSSYLDMADHFVGTVGLEAPDETSLLTLSKPNADGQRIMWSCFPRSGENGETTGDYETERTILYLYRIGGRRYAFTKPEGKQQGFTVVRIETSSGTIRLHGIEGDRFRSSWPTRNFKDETYIARCRDDPQQIADALADDRIAEQLFDPAPIFNLDPSRNLITTNSKERSLRRITLSMRLPGEPSRVWVLFMVAFSFMSGFVLSVENTVGEIDPLGENIANVRKHGSHRDPIAVAKDIFWHSIWVTIFLSTISLWTWLPSLGGWAIVAAAVGCGIVVGGWLTVENHSLVQLIANTFRWSTLTRSLFPVCVCVLLVFPGLVATTWVESQVLRLATTVPESVAIDIPGASGYRPIVRAPTWKDGWIKCACGVPVVDHVKYEIEGQRLSFESLSAWRSTIINMLSVLFTLALFALMLMLLRVIIGIVLRIAATDEERGVSYCPAN